MKRAITSLSWTGTLSAVAGFLVLIPFVTEGVSWIGHLREPMACKCIGPTNASHRAVYLHGLDTRGPSWQEYRNRVRLRTLATALGIRIALPRRGGAWTVDQERSQALLHEAARSCFGDDASFGVIGFSNGGYFANALFLRCDEPQIAWVVSVGSEGDTTRPSGSLSDCGRIRLIAGRHEPTLIGTRAFARFLTRNGADVGFLEHPGPHELPFEQTYSAVKELVDEGAHGN